MWCWPMQRAPLPLLMLCPQDVAHPLTFSVLRPLLISALCAWRSASWPAESAARSLPAKSTNSTLPPAACVAAAVVWRAPPAAAWWW